MTSAVPLAPELQPQFVNFRAERKAYVVHNAGKKPRETMYGGNMFTIPPVSAVSGRVPGEHRSSETDADGDVIPGTLVIEDIYVYIPDLEEEVLLLDATRTVRHILGISKGSDGQAAVATSRFALGGLSLLPRHPTKEMWHAVGRAGSQRAFLVEVDNARNLIQSIDSANARRRAAGNDPVPAGADYDFAVALIKEYNKLVKAETMVTAEAAPHEADTIELELELEAFAKARATELAEKAVAGTSLDKVALAKQLLNDPSVRVKLQKEYQIRKKGHLPVPDAKLHDALMEDKTVDEIEGGDEQ